MTTPKPTPEAQAAAWKKPLHITVREALVSDLYDVLPLPLYEGVINAVVSLVVAGVEAGREQERARTCRWKPLRHDWLAGCGPFNTPKEDFDSRWKCCGFCGGRIEVEP